MMKISIEKLIKIIIETIAELDRIPYVQVLTSNRHIHLSKEDMEILFGSGYELKPTRELLPGQFACEESLNVIGKSGTLKKVRVLSPIRSKTQLELSMTDNFTLGIRTPLNDSGNLKGAALVTLENPLNSKKVERECAIIARRHIHITPEFSAKHALKDGQTVSVEVDSLRGIVFKDVLIRVSKEFREEMHIDTDEANAGHIKNGDLGRIIKHSSTPEEAASVKYSYSGTVLSHAEVMGKAGVKEIVIKPDCVVTMLAYETARKLGIVIRKKEA